jgi:hypothetical protein
MSLDACGDDCQAWASGLSASVSGDSVRVIVEDEESSDAFVVRGFEFPGAAPETLATFAGTAVCGLHSTTAHVLPVWNTSLSAGDVIATDGSGFPMWSTVFAANDSAWTQRMIADGECIKTSGDSMSVGAAADTTFQLVDGQWVARGLNPPDAMREPPHDFDCGDVLIYGTGSTACWYDTVAAQVRRYWSGSRHLQPQAHSSGGNTSPATAHAQYMLLRQRNMSYNDTWGDVENEHYPDTPMLILVGYPTVLMYPNADCAHCDECGVNGCSSYTLITDVDADGIPDGPVSLIPALTTAEVTQACHMADEWNTGLWRDPERGVAVFMGDERACRGPLSVRIASRRI